MTEKLKVVKHEWIDDDLYLYLEDDSVIIMTNPYYVDVKYIGLDEDLSEETKLHSSVV